MASDRVIILLFVKSFIGSSIPPKIRSMLIQFARQQALSLYFAITFLLSWTIWFSGAALGYAASLEHFATFLFLGSFAPALAALLVSAWRGGAQEAQTLLKRIVQVRVPFMVYLATWFIFPSVISLGLVVLGFPFKTDAALNIGTLIIAMPINGFLTAFLSPGPLGEEPGWRGFATPQMQHLPEWQANIVLGLIWAFWHLPIAILFPEWRELMPNVDVGLPLWLVLYPISIIALTIMLAKLWKWSGQSIFICILFHGVINTTFHNFDKVSTPYSATVSFILLDVLLWLIVLIFLILDKFVFEAKRLPNNNQKNA